MERKKQRISDLFYDNRFLLVFSVLFAVIAWLIVATEFSETQNTISNVPVQINYSNISNTGNLQPFIDKEYTVDVTISGKRYIVESDDIKDDILVVADTSLINSAGEFPLTLSVSSKSVRPEYEFVSVYPQKTEKITFDYLKSNTLNIEPKITFNHNPTKDGLFMGEATIPVSHVKTVEFSGPQTAVQRVVRVEARAEHEGNLDKTTTIEATLVAVDENGNPVSGISFGKSSPRVNVTIPVYSKKELDITCSFSNLPYEYVGNIPFEYSVSPSVAMFAVNDDNEDIDKAELTTKIDFTDLNVGENILPPIKADKSEFTGCGLLDESITEFVITVNVSGVVSKSFKAKPENIIIENKPDGVDVNFSEFQFSNLTVIGPEENISSLTDDNLVLIADFKDVDVSNVDSVAVPVRVYDGYCWSFGDYYAKFNIL